MTFWDQWRATAGDNVMSALDVLSLPLRKLLQLGKLFAAGKLLPAAERGSCSVCCGGGDLTSERTTRGPLAHDIPHGTHRSLALLFLILLTRTANADVSPQSGDHLQELYRHAAPCVGLMYSGGGFGACSVVNSSGLVLTCAHIIGEPSEPVRVEFADGRQFGGKSKFVCRTCDIAFVQLDKWPGGSFLQISSDANFGIGDQVAVVGHPSGQTWCFAPGIISQNEVYGYALSGRSASKQASTGALTRWFRVSASLGPGFSGGPVIDTSGHIVGVVSLNDMRSAGVLVTPARECISLMEIGEHQHPYLGVLVDERWIYYEYDMEHQGIPIHDGLVVDGVMWGSPAHEAVKSRDLLTGFVNGRSVNVLRSKRDLHDCLQQSGVGAKVTIQLIRDGREESVPMEVRDANIDQIEFRRVLEPQLKLEMLNEQEGVVTVVVRSALPYTPLVRLDVGLPNGVEFVKGSTIKVHASMNSLDQKLHSEDAMAQDADLCRGHTVDDGIASGGVEIGRVRDRDTVRFDVRIPQTLAMGVFLIRITTASTEVVYPTFVQVERDSGDILPAPR